MSYRDENERMAYDLDMAERDAERFHSAAKSLSKELDRRTAELEERISDLEGERDALKGILDNRDETLAVLQERIAELEQDKARLEAMIDGQWFVVNATSDVRPGWRGWRVHGRGNRLLSLGHDTPRAAIDAAMEGSRG